MWSPQERLDVIGQLRNLAKLYPRKLDSETIDSYCEVLLFLKPDAIRRGMKDLVADRVKSQFPTPGEIVSYAKQYQPKPKEIECKEVEIPKEHRGYLTLVKTSRPGEKFKGIAIPYDMRDARLVAMGVSYRKFVGKLPHGQFCKAMAEDMIAQGVDVNDPMIQEYREQARLAGV